MKLVNRNRKNRKSNVVVVTSFEKIKPRDFVLVHGNLVNIDKEMFLCSNDGRIFINKDNELSEFLHGFFDTITTVKTETLLEYKAMYEEKFPDIKSFDDLITMEDKESNIVYALTLLCVPIEINRRKIAKNCYNYDMQDK